MKSFLTIIFCLTLTTLLMGQSENPDYDANLADSLGADD